MIFRNPNTESLDTARTPASAGGLPLWREYDNEDEYYLELSDTPESKTRMRASYRHFWTKYLPQLMQHMKEVFNEGAKSAIVEKPQQHQPKGQAVAEGNLLGLMLGGIIMALVVIIVS